MDTQSLLTILTLGTLLAASTGLRAFITPFMLSVAGGMGWIQLSPELAWLGSPIAIGTLGLAIILEVLADKFPLVDHAMDTVHLLVKPATGALVAAILVDDQSPMLTWTVAMLGGGSLSGLTHLGKAGLRAGSTATTAGLGNPVISVIEDLIAVAVSGGAIWGVSQI